MNLLNYGGIDVSKNMLDLHIHPVNFFKSYQNNEKGIKDLFTQVKKHKCHNTVLEPTGGYEKRVFLYFNKTDIPLQRVNPYRVRHFAKGLGHDAKTDRIDASVLSKYSSVIPKFEAYKLNDKENEIQDLNRRLEQLEQMKIQEKNRLRRSPDSAKPSIQKILDVLIQEEKEITELINNLIDSDKQLSAKQEILKTCGFGKTTVLKFLCEMPELGRVSNKRIASLVGVAPFSNESGLFKGKSRIWGGRKRVRNCLFMSFISKIRWRKDPIINKYDRLLKAGKPKKVAIVACMRTMLVRANEEMKTFLDDF